MDAMHQILVTGAAGYIGSHTCLALLSAGYSVVALDNLCNGHAQSLQRVKQLTGKDFPLIEGDIRDKALLKSTMQAHSIDAVIHFAALKSVGESVAMPLAYYDNNIAGSATLLQVMKDVGIKTFVFSSSATVYGQPERLPLTEDHPLSVTNPYGRSKLFVEDMLRDLYRSDPSWQIGILRYFNPVGAHESGLIGEDPRGTPNNLMPYVAQVAVGRRDKLQIWGADYDTADGTGVRDYIHVQDLAQGHLKALQKLSQPQCFAVNLGTGRGYSVLEVVKALEQASGKAIPYQLCERRAGDVAACYADPSYAAELLGWRAQRGIEQMCADHWHWQSKHPHGFAEA